MKYYSVFAQAYGEGTYSSCTYSNSSSTQCVAAAGTGSSNSGGGSLANTGMALVTVLTLACLIIFATLLIRVWRRKPVVQEVQDVDETEEKRLSDRF